MADQINDEIDLIALLKSLLKKKKLILKLTLIGGLIGLIVGLLTPKTYTSSVTFILQQSDGKQLNSSLGGLASLAGINLNRGGNSSIAPVIYPEILKSYPFKKSLISKEVIVDGESLTYKEYNLNNNNRCLFSGLERRASTDQSKLHKLTQLSQRHLSHTRTRKFTVF